jgi:hypothetical protein
VGSEIGEGGNAHHTWGVNEDYIAGRREEHKGGGGDKDHLEGRRRKKR